MNLGGSKKGKRSPSGRPISEINITPMVDVMLVLLIIFMVAAPMMSSGVPIDLPKTQALAMEPKTRPITVSVTVDGDVFVDNTPASLDTLLQQVADLAVDGVDERLLVRGDTKVGYGFVMEVMGLLSSAGYNKLGLVTEQANER